MTPSVAFEIDPQDARPEIENALLGGEIVPPKSAMCRVAEKCLLRVWCLPQFRFRHRLYVILLQVQPG